MDMKTEHTKVIAEPGKQEIIIMRDFDAPVDLVYRAFTEAELVAQWQAPRRFEIIVDEMDVRFGGIWRLINRDADGNEYAFRGVFHEVAPTRLVRTFEWEGMPGHISLEAATFGEQAGRTYLGAKSVFQSVEDRDGMLQGGMEEGVEETYDRLAELLKRLQN